MSRFVDRDRFIPYLSAYPILRAMRLKCAFVTALLISSAQILEQAFTLVPTPECHFDMLCVNDLKTMPNAILVDQPAHAGHGRFVSSFQADHSELYAQASDAVHDRSQRAQFYFEPHRGGLIRQCCTPQWMRPSDAITALSQSRPQPV